MGKSEKKYEQILKGAANHRRIEILKLLEKMPEMSVADISDETKTNFKTISVHIQMLARSGLVAKRYEGNHVRHAITSRGKSILKFLRILE